MNETLKKYIDPVKRFWDKLNKKSRITLGLVLGGILIVALVLGIFLNRTQYVMLYSGLENDEATEITGVLAGDGVSYQQKDGSIYVPSDKEDSLRMELANMGYPKTAPNYDYFTKNIDIMTTDYEKKIIEKYQMNQRLEAVIETLDPIKSANVTISIPDESGYAWDENKTKPSASVTVEMVAGKTLEAAQVNGIKQLVAKSVPNLEAANVAVIDTATGEELESSDSLSQTNVSKFKLEIEKQYENDIKAKVLNVLVPLYGAENIDVSVKATMDLDKKIQEIITYNPSVDNKGVISESSESTTTSTNGSGNSASGVPGSTTNSDVTSYPGITVDGNTIYSADDKSYKYLVSQVKQQIQGDAATVKDMTVSVVINKDIIDDVQKGELQKLIANSSAIAPEKVVIYNSAFWQAKVVPAAAPDVSSLFSTKNIIIAGAGLVALLLIFITLMIILKKSKKNKKNKKQSGPVSASPKEGKSKNKKMEEVWEDNPDKESEQEELMRILREQQNSKDAKLNQQIQDFSSQNPEIVAQLIRNWLKGDKNNG